MIGLIWAQDPDGVIGFRGGLPWKVPEDLARFKEITMGHPVIMGRKTWDSLGRALPRRTNVVISGRPGAVLAEAAGGGAGPVAVASSFAQALEIAGTSPGSEEVWIIGGESVFARAIGLADTVCVTYLRERYRGDVFAPRLDGGPGGAWVAKRQEPDGGSWKRSRGGAEYRFVDYARAGS